ncbi:MAG: hypothetical protein OHK0053_38250 [Microscillaceae bacterium]
MICVYFRILFYILVKIIRKVCSERDARTVAVAGQDANTRGEVSQKFNFFDSLYEYFYFFGVKLGQ